MNGHRFPRQPILADMASAGFKRVRWKQTNSIMIPLLLQE